MPLRRWFTSIADRLFVGLSTAQYPTAWHYDIKNAVFFVATQDKLR